MIFLPFQYLHFDMHISLANEFEKVYQLLFASLSREAAGRNSASVHEKGDCESLIMYLLSETNAPSSVSFANLFDGLI